ncbi:MAG: trigger factor [Planctomycetota bacterium]
MLHPFSEEPAPGEVRDAQGPPHEHAQPMQVEVGTTGPCTRTLKIRIPPERIKEHIDEMFAAAARQVQVKGFRKGKIPRQVLEKKFGKDILEQAKERLVNQCFTDACREQDVVPVGRADIADFDKLSIEPGRDLEFTVSFDIKPEFELLDVRNLEAERFENAASDEDVERALGEIANQKRSIHGVDGPSAEGDFLKVDIAFLDAGGHEVHTRKNVQINTRIPLAGTDPEAFAKALTGVEKGATVRLPLVFPDNFEKDQWRGKQGEAAITVHEVLRVSPAPIDDSLARSLDFKDLESLREDLRARIGQEKIRSGKRMQEDQLLEKVLAMHDFELPPSLVEEQTEASLHAFAHRLEESGMSKEDIDKKIEESRAEAEADARRRVKLFFLVQAIAEKQKIFVTEGDIQNEVRAIAEQNRVTPAKVAEFLEKNRQWGELRLSLLERKVREFLRDSAKIVDRQAG